MAFATIEELPSEWRSIAILLNNAGLAVGSDLFDAADLHDWENMLHTNINGLLYVSKALSR